MAFVARLCTQYGIQRVCVVPCSMVPPLRYLSTTFKFEDLKVEPCSKEKLSKKPDSGKLVFGKHFSDHMLEVAWDAENGWGRPKISPFHNLSLHPGSKVLHYAAELFEGMKAFRGADGKIRLFRPDMNMKRMNATAARAGLPVFDGDELIRCMKKLISIDKEWVPYSDSSSLYIRPTLIGTDPSLGVAIGRNALLYVILGPVGPYFATGVKPVALLADPKYVRAWPGGCGDKKMGSNYAPTVYIQKQAESLKFQQVLWLFGNDHQLTEVGTMNIFVFLVNENGEKELVTPPLNGLILPGVIRQSLLDLGRNWNDFKVSERNITMNEVVKALNDKRLLEMFGAGTACVVCPVRSIHYLGKDYSLPSLEQDDPLSMRFLKALTDIQYGRTTHPWAVDINTLEDRRPEQREDASRTPLSMGL